MRSNSIFRRLGALALCAALMVGLAAPAAADQENVIHIRTKEDWKQLTEQCRLDQWSRGKTVILDSNLELSGEMSIPTFGGEFQGNGHTIRGLILSTEGDHRGLFRYLQEGAVVSDLVVLGVADPEGNCGSVGGIVGVNRGSVIRCQYQGNVNATRDVGGIAGVNEATGQILNCTARGSVTGESCVGGIVGQNYGSVISCVNESIVNGGEGDFTVDLSSISLDNLNETTLPAATDAGGIAGYSKGVLQSCINKGAVGYPHTGYNVGGIVGRQSGYVNGCLNEGEVQGRKEVGGIVGQMEPYTLLRFEEDTLQALMREVDVLTELLNGTLGDVDGSRHEISDHLTAMTDLTDSAGHDISSLLDDLEELGSGTIDTANELSARVAQFMGEMDRVTGDMGTASDRLSDGLRQLQAAAGKAGQAEGPIQDAAADMQRALEHLNDAVKALVGRVPVLLAPPFTPGQIDKALEESKETLTELKDIVDEVLNIAQKDLDASINSFQSASGNISETAKILGAAMDIIEDAMGDLAHSSDSLGSAFDRLQSAIQDQNDLPTLEFPKLDSSFHETGDRLDMTLENLLQRMRELQSSTNQAGDGLSANLRKIHNQYKNITNVLRDAQNREDEDGLVKDVSEENQYDVTWGKVATCVNKGKVDGDVNVGGLAGSMAVEIGFDPEDDLVKEGKPSADVKYLTHAVLSGGSNSGSVRARKNCAGGVVGRMALGVVFNCENYGPVESTRGEYVGGIAGISYAAIRNSWSKCDLSGKSHVGGIAGMGTDVSGCRSLVKIQEGRSFVGAIAGECTGKMEENLFVSKTLGGVDGVSYAGQAEPAEYAQFLLLEGIPKPFQQLTITFVADDKIIQEIPVNYGEGLTDEQIPAVPRQRGCHGSWEEFERDSITFDQRVEAVYTQWLTAVSSWDGVILAEGQFTPDSSLHTVDRIDLTPPVQEALGMWELKTENGQPFTAIRVRGPEKGRGELWQYVEGDGWRKLPTTQEGSYLRAELNGDRAVICLAEAPAPVGLWAISALAAAAVLLLVVKKAKSKHTKTRQPVEK